jgi:hypothetical protein
MAPAVPECVVKDCWEHASVPPPRRRGGTLAGVGAAKWGFPAGAGQGCRPGATAGGVAQSCGVSVSQAVRGIVRFDAGCDGLGSLCGQGYYLVTGNTTCG